MKGFCLVSVLMVAGACAQEAAVFQAPKAYEVQRYEAGWNKNPFTLKTTAEPVANAAFAQDLIIGSFYGAVDDPTIVLVNTKTRERFRLKQGESTPGGILLAVVNVDRKTRRQTFVQVSHAGETVKLRYEAALAASAQTPTPAKQAATTAPPPASSASSAEGVTRRLPTLVIHKPKTSP